MSPKVCKMNISRWAFGIILALGVLNGAGLIRENLRIGSSNAVDYAAIDEYVRGEMEAASMPGVSYAIVQDGEIVHKQVPYDFRRTMERIDGTKLESRIKSQLKHILAFGGLA